MRKLKNERSVCHIWLCYGAKVKEETTSSTWVTSQDDLAMEITHSKGMGLNGLCPNESFFLTEGRLLEGEKGLAY